MEAGSHIGPYRIEARLGGGGMGEVFRASDSRLGRRVAIKFVRPARAEEPRARRRLRREARAVATLNDPAIVQIYDIVESDDGSSGIVMEYVEGETLAEHLERGELELSSFVSLMGDVARGLTQAHERGIVHRDLKAENVMVTPHGQAKILDFGLATVTDPSTVLTGENHLVGTLHAMSPEQVQGLELDARSDLFSLGTLLYRGVTGRYPFLGKTPGETLAHINLRRQPAARDVNPEAPESLSGLIDALLEKEPVHRPESAEAVAAALDAVEAELAAGGEPRRRSLPAQEVYFQETLTSERPALDGPTLEGPAPQEPEPRHRPDGGRGRHRVALTIAALIALALGMTTLLHRQPDARSVAIAEPVYEASGALEEPPLALAGVRAGLFRGLRALDGVVVLDPALDTGRGETPPASPRALARALAADEVITSRLTCAALGCRITLSRLDGESGRVLSFEELEAPGDDLYLLSRAVERRLAPLFPGRNSVPSALPDLAVPEADYAEYLRLHLSFRFGDEALDLDALAERLDAVRRRSPDFHEATLLAADLAHARFLESRRPEALDRALDLAEEARQQAPNESLPLHKLFAIAFDGARLELAAGAQERLAELALGSARVLMQRAWLEERAGRPAEALELMRRAVARRPSWNNLFSLAQLESQQGRADHARRHVREALERSPGNFKCLSLLAQLELLSGEPHAAVELYEELARLSPGVQEKSNLGVAQLLVGEHAAAAETFGALIEAGPTPPHPSIVLNLADALGLSGEGEAARRHYARVVELVDGDPAPSVYLLSARAQALAHLGRKVEAVAALREILRRDPDNAYLLQEAALVYALVGEESSALAHIDAALDAGVEARWFRLPFYAELDRRQLNALLESRRPSRGG